MRRDFVALDDFILHRAVQIGERRSEHGNHLLESHSASWHSPTQMMADAIKRDHFIYDSKITLVESLVEEMLDNGFVLNW
jgi:hypothetical protein